MNALENKADNLRGRYRKATKHCQTLNNRLDSLRSKCAKIAHEIEVVSFREQQLPSWPTTDAVRNQRDFLMQKRAGLLEELSGIKAKIDQWQDTVDAAGNYYDQAHADWLVAEIEAAEAALKIAKQRDKDATQRLEAQMRSARPGNISVLWDAQKHAADVLESAGKRLDKAYVEAAYVAAGRL